MGHIHLQVNHRLVLLLEADVNIRIILCITQINQEVLRMDIGHDFSCDDLIVHQVDDT